MKIEQSTLTLQSQHSQTALRTQSERLHAWTGAQRPDFGDRPPGWPRPAMPAPSDDGGVRLTLSAAAQARLRQDETTGTPAADTRGRGGAAPAAAAGTAPVTEAGDPVGNDPRMQLLAQMVEAITGRAVRVFDVQAAMRVQTQSTQVQAVQTTATTPTDTGQRAVQPQGWGIEYDQTTLVQETEQTQVSMQGTVRTADGQEIRFELQLDMRRTYTQQTQVSLRAGDAVRPPTDPLVLNFDGNAAQLTDTRFAFDLNGDGQDESIPFVTGGSGLLVLDRNQDGRANDGSELFGPASGDGFADLARHDSDGNRWIDESDPVYAQLRVWQRDASGQDRLTPLADLGVGAIHLGSVASPFTLKDGENQSLGQVRSSGVFLYASGQAGSVQQVDL